MLTDITSFDCLCHVLQILPACAIINLFLNHELNKNCDLEQMFRLEKLIIISTLLIYIMNKNMYSLSYLTLVRLIFECMHNSFTCLQSLFLFISDISMRTAHIDNGLVTIMEVMGHNTGLQTVLLFSF